MSTGDDDYDNNTDYDADAGAMTIIRRTFMYNTKHNTKRIKSLTSGWNQIELDIFLHASQSLL